MDALCIGCGSCAHHLDADAEILNAWAGPSTQKTEQGDGTLTFYSVEVPTVNIPVDVGVIG